MKKDIAKHNRTYDYRVLKSQIQSEINDKMLGQHMQTVRQQRGMTQAVVAEQMKVGIQYYSALERGKARISLYRLIQFICLMDTSADFLLTGCHHEYPSYYVCPDQIAENRKHLISLLDHCSDSTISILQIVAEALIRNQK